MFNDRCITKRNCSSQASLAPCFGLQLDETTDITSKAQLIVYVRFPSTQRMKIVDHYLLCLSIGIDTTAFSVFSKLDNYFSEHEVMWFKCKSVPTDGARAMVRVRSGVVALIKQVAPEVVSIHCILHREALVAKKLANEEKNCQLADVICDITKIVTTILKNRSQIGRFMNLSEKWEMMCVLFITLKLGGCLVEE